MRVAILGTRGIPAHYGGFETFAEELAVRLVRAGIDVTVYCENRSESFAEVYKGVRLVYIPVLNCGPLTTVLFDVRCLFHARKIFDVVYLLGYGAAPFCLVPRICGTKVWLNVDGVEWARAKWSPVAKLYFKLMEWFSTWTPSRLIADADGILEHFSARHHLAIPSTTIPYGAELVEYSPDESFLNEWSLCSGKYFLVVARLEPENHIIEIVQGYLKSNCHLPLVVVGDHSTDTSYVKNLLCYQGDMVRFIGGVYDKDKLRALRWHCTAYFHGHSVGGTNPSLLEALGCGNVIIAHDNKFNREVCVDFGLYFNNIDDIAPLIDDILNVPHEKYLQMKILAKGRIERYYNWERIAEMYQDLLRGEFRGK